MVSENNQPADTTPMPQPRPSSPTAGSDDAVYEPPRAAYESAPAGTVPLPPEAAPANVLANASATGADSAATGRTTISETAVAKVAGIAARKVRGVAALGSGSRAFGALREAVGSSDLTQGVRVEVGETQAAVDITLIAAYGVPLQDIANGVRAAVYSAVETLTGMKVIEVNVEVSDVHVPEVHDAKPATEK